VASCVLQRRHVLLHVASTQRARRAVAIHHGILLRRVQWWRERRVGVQQVLVRVACAAASHFAMAR